MSKKIQTTIGTVASVSEKSLVVVVSRKVKNQLGRYVKCTTKMHAHDENKVAKAGDEVSIKPCKPYSKQKTWELHEVINTKGDVKEAI